MSSAPQREGCSPSKGTDLDRYNARRRERYASVPEVRAKAKASAEAIRKSERGKANARNARLLRLYGITTAQFDELLAAQGGVCAMCGRPPKSKSLNVDHDHKTGLVRGLLCWHCNSRVVGGARDDIELLRAAVAYLEVPPAVAVLGEVYGRTGRITKKRRKRRTTVKRKGTIG